MFDFKEYLKALKKHKPEEITEHTLRPDLQALLLAFAVLADPKIKVLHEPKRHVDYGAPDFKITLKEGILGYVENKALGTDLNPVLKTDQIDRYKKLSGNILLTNYLDWIWIKEDKQHTRISLCTMDELYQHRFTPDPSKLEEVSKLISSFFSNPPKGIGKPKALAEALGQRGKLLKNYLWDELKRQEETDNEGRLFGLYNTFKKMVDHELTLEDFTDTFAQMLVYGLFMARLNSESEKIDLFNVEKFIPTSFELIQELVGFLKVLNKAEYSETRWIVEEVLAILNTMNLSGILSALSFDKHNKVADPETAKDPYVYFYEDFLAAYDKALKKAKGVYYTPPPVVKFIIRAVNDVLKDTFGIAEGLADHKKVTLLDFACGTGTFLLETIRQILDATPDVKRALIIKEHILKNLYGFEYMIAPYTVAHLKLTQYLKNSRYPLSEQDRVKIFLTNTLETFEDFTGKKGDGFLPALEKECRTASDVKERPILVITGNPPYNIKSQMKKSKKEDHLSKIDLLLKAYYNINDESIDEVNSKIIRNDYIKFIRFAEWKMESVSHGIVAVITQNSFIEKPLLRAMRYHLKTTFNQLYVLNLHGDYREQSGENKIEDKNVFDIREGVAISILIKDGSNDKNIYVSDCIGTRKDKYEFLSNTLLKDVSWSKIDLLPPEYKFCQIDLRSFDEYSEFPSLKDIYISCNSGIKTHRNHFVVSFSKDDLIHRISYLINANISDNELVQMFHLKNTRDWNLNESRKVISRDHDRLSSIIRYSFAPFDTRFLFYHDQIVELPRHEIMDHINEDNIALLSTRNNVQRSMGYVFVSDKPSDVHLLEDSTNVYPLYLYFEVEYLGSFNYERKPNIKAEIFELLKDKYAAQNTTEITPEAIMGYIYAALHSPTYRQKYKDFLKTDFPRIPFCEDFGVFEQMSALGWQLINAHLMKSEDLKQKYPLLGTYTTKGSNEVSKVFYADNLERLYINDTQYFDAIPEPVYQFHIGGYQVLNKYLKDRKTRVLNLDEINNVESIARILAFTMDTMREIDMVSRDWI
jgi:type I restriction-modification system DNA methylase subunit